MINKINEKEIDNYTPDISELKKIINFKIKSFEEIFKYTNSKKLENALKMNYLEAK